LGKSSPTGSAQTPSVSLQEIRQQKEAAKSQKQQEALKYLNRGKEAQAAGKAKTAKIYYQMAARRASGELKSQVESLLKKLERE